MVSPVILGRVACEFVATIRMYGSLSETLVGSNGRGGLAFKWELELLALGLEGWMGLV